MARPRRIAIPVALIAMVTGCSVNPSGHREELLVFAAASLRDAIGQTEATFEVEYPEFDVLVNLASSSSLREQILEGAPADVFASANTANMDQVVEAGGVVGVPTIFVHNLLQVAVPAGNPAGITGLADFANPDLLIGLCAEEVPCGSLGRQTLANAAVTASIDTNEPDVRALLTKIEAGELDAGIVYVTDVLAAGGGVEGIDIPEDMNVVAEYPIVALRGGTNREAAAAFVTFVISAPGKALFADFGFQSP
jgi:molybdate transport system substrate-binding protein